LLLPPATSQLRLRSLFVDNLESIVAALTEASFVEMGLTGLIVHRDPG